MVRPRCEIDESGICTANSEPAPIRPTTREGADLPVQNDVEAEILVYR